MTQEMRILTVRQPWAWAWAIIHGGKNIENRVRNLAGDYRGPVAIHTALTGATFDGKHAKLWPFDSRHITGSIIGVVDLVGVHVARAAASGRRVDWAEHTKPEELCSPWAIWDNWHLEMANPRLLSTPIPWKGALGLRKLPAEVAGQILANAEQVTA
jgi:hypothetical protein